MFFVISHLNFAPACRFIDCLSHTLGNFILFAIKLVIIPQSQNFLVCLIIFIQRFIHVSIHNHMAFTISGRTSNGLNQTTFITQETFLISVQDSDQRNFWHVDSFTQQVNPHQDIKNTQTQISNNLCPLQSLNITVHILDFDTHFFQISTQVL